MTDVKNCECIGFQKEYLLLTSTMQKDEPNLFNLSLIVAYSSELKNGYVVDRKLKTTPNGTKFNYKKAKSNQEIQDHMTKIRDMINNLDSDMTLTELSRRLAEYND